jgi:hypothetical protein
MRDVWYGFSFFPKSSFLANASMILFRGIVLLCRFSVTIFIFFTISLYGSRVIYPGLRASVTCTYALFFSCISRKGFLFYL